MVSTSFGGVLVECCVCVFCGWEKHRKTSVRRPRIRVGQTTQGGHCHARCGGFVGGARGASHYWSGEADGECVVFARGGEWRRGLLMTRRAKQAGRDEARKSCAPHDVEPACVCTTKGGKDQ